MRDWNVVVTVLPDGFRDAVRILAPFGPVVATDYYGVLVMKVDDGRAFMESLRALLTRDATLANAVARLVPVTETFTYESAEEFRAKTDAVVAAWAADLASRRFYVRMHRRGFKGKLASNAEERRLGEFLLAHVPPGSEPAHIDFDRPDVVIAVETVGTQAGLARFSRVDLERYELLRLA
jgi:tRNA(Ser,Leu) C12 N-acetylase TAN1